MSEGCLWRIEDHVCRECLGRVVSRQAEDGQAVMRCSNCGLEAIGGAETVCACGIRRGGHSGLRCIQLDAPISGINAEVIVTESG